MCSVVREAMAKQDPKPLIVFARCCSRLDMCRAHLSLSHFMSRVVSSLLASLDDMTSSSCSRVRSGLPPHHCSSWRVMGRVASCHVSDRLVSRAVSSLKASRRGRVSSDVMSRVMSCMRCVWCVLGCFDVILCLASSLTLWH